jgi:cobalamin biosynthesis protein CbiD
VLAQLAKEAGGPDGIEYLQSRDIEKTILFGMPGTLAKIEAGEFPPRETERTKSVEA